MKALLIALSISVCATLAPVSESVAEDKTDEDRLQSVSGDDWKVEIISDSLNYPWDIEAAGDQLILTEAAGNIVMLHQGELQRYVVKTSDPVVNEGGSGLLGMALAKDFTKSGVAWLYHTYRSDSGLTNKVIKVHFDGRQWQETGVLLAGIPGHRLYNGGRIAIGPDGFLYVTTGWTEDEQRPQDIQNLAGKVLRMTLDGKQPQDNPIPGSLVYSLGHRNPQGLAWNQRGELFITEHGQNAHDEINLVTPRSNYGWPEIQGDEERAGMKTAWLNSGSQTWAPSGATFAGDNLLVAALGAKGLYMFDKTKKNLRQIFSSGDRLRDVITAGNDIYVITTNRSPRAEGPSADRLIKLTLKQ
ncbi:glucose/arabinose dehydrogenase [Erwinia toletana]|uniref:Glucose/arabinose dehydrogenase n=1 Tax=Winslowiella toletana TaxID=92490 RepID=A0ABS4PDQ6_9GAMM|nr:PQQ-dependent sugar dehydrogenase [Winslowiella toletana]MBP2170769.1 glucose/arabinose dehydrogenase [Winslowiella toletana]